LGGQASLTVAFLLASGAALGGTGQTPIRNPQSAGVQLDVKHWSAAARSSEATDQAFYPTHPAS
jgi:hypothetical protein